MLNSGPLLRKEDTPDHQTRGQTGCRGAFGKYLMVVATALMAQTRRPQRQFCRSNSESPRCLAAGQARANTTESSAQTTAGLLARNTAGNILPAHICKSSDVF